MGLFKPDSFSEAIDILNKIKPKITDTSDFASVPYASAEKLRKEIDLWIGRLNKKDKTSFEEIASHFLPTCTFQEHSNSNGWSDEYIILAKQFDNVYKRLKPI